jgi:hypothetical protein
MCASVFQRAFEATLGYFDLMWANMVFANLKNAHCPQPGRPPDAENCFERFDPVKLLTCRFRRVGCFANRFTHAAPLANRIIPAQNLRVAEPTASQAR